MDAPAAPPKPPFRYQAQDAGMTLAEGLAEYYAVHPQITRPDNLPPESAELFRHHDLCHVIFGLDITLPDEGMADIRTMLGTDVGPRRYMRYLLTNKEAMAIFEEIGWTKGLLSLIPLTPRILKALWRAPRQKRWPWNVPADYLDVPLKELRARHRIRVF